MAKRRTNPDFLDGVPELLILRLLSMRAMYGYQIVQAIKSSSQGQLDFGEGCIYPILHRLEQERMLGSRRKTVGGRSRVVYRITRLGRHRLLDSTSTWRQVVDAVTHVLQGDEHGSPAMA